MIPESPNPKFASLSTFDLQQRVRDLEAEISEMQDEILLRFHREIGVIRLPPTATELTRPAARPVERARVSGTPRRSYLADLLRGKTAP